MELKYLMVMENGSLRQNYYNLHRPTGSNLNQIKTISVLQDLIGFILI